VYSAAAGTDLPVGLCQHGKRNINRVLVWKVDEEEGNRRRIKEEM